MITTERIPPQSPEAEKAVLGALMIDRESMMDLSETLKPEDFYFPAHQEIPKKFFLITLAEFHV